MKTSWWDPNKHYIVHLKKSTVELLKPTEQYILDYGDFPEVDLGLAIEEAITKAYNRGFRVAEKIYTNKH